MNGVENRSESTRPSQSLPEHNRHRTLTCLVENAVTFECQKNFRISVRFLPTAAKRSSYHQDWIPGTGKPPPSGLTSPDTHQGRASTRTIDGSHEGRPTSLRTHERRSRRCRSASSSATISIRHGLYGLSQRLGADGARRRCHLRDRSPLRLPWLHQPEVAGSAGHLPCTADTDSHDKTCANRTRRTPKAPGTQRLHQTRQCH